MHRFSLFVTVMGLIVSSVSPLSAQETSDQVLPVKPEPALTDPVVIVNGTLIDYATLKRAQTTLPFRPLSTAEPPDGALSKEALALEQLISRQLLYEAAVAHKTSIASNDVDVALTRFLRRLPGPRAYQTLLSELKMTESDLKHELARDLTIEAFTSQLIANITVETATVKRYYDDHPHLFAENAKIRFREIYLIKKEPPTIDPELEKVIERIQADIDREVDFIRLADRYTPNGEIKNGGDRGYFQAGSLDPDLEDRLFAMEVDEIHGPIETDTAVLFIKMVDKQVEQLVPFPTVKKEIENFLLAEQRQTKIVNYIEQLKANADIKRLLPIDLEPEEIAVE